MDWETGSERHTIWYEFKAWVSPTPCCSSQLLQAALVICRPPGSSGCGLWPKLSSTPTSAKIFHENCSLEACWPWHKWHSSYTSQRGKREFCQPHRGSLAVWKRERQPKWPGRASLSTNVSRRPNCLHDICSHNGACRQTESISKWVKDQALSIERHWEGIPLSPPVGKSALTLSRVERTINIHLDSECPGRRHRRPSC